MSGWGWQTAAAALVVLTLGGGWLIWYRQRGPTTQYVAQKLERGSIVRTVSATGVVRPLATAPVRARVSGVIQSLYCDSNMKVKEDQLCAKLDLYPYQAAIDQEKFNLTEAEIRLEKDKADLAQAKAIFKRNQIQAKRRVVSRDVLNKSRKAYKEAQARTTLDEATVAQRQAALHGAEINLSYTDIVAPVGGTVVSRNVKIGQTLAMGSGEPPLFLIATDLTTMQVDANLSENDLSKVKLGDKASFTVESFPNQAFAGEVIQIGQIPRTVMNVMTYDVVISAPNPDLLLEPGMAMAITIMVDRCDNILRAPDQALRYSPGRLNADPRALPDSSSRLWFLVTGS
jgi:HlyD family secretion protein